MLNALFFLGNILFAFFRLGRQAPGDLAEVGGIAHLGDDHLSRSVDHLRSAVETSRLLEALRGVVGHDPFRDRLGLAGHQGLIDVQVDGLDQSAVRGNLVAHLQQHRVADDHVLQRQAVEGAVADHLDRQRFFVGIEDLEFAIAAVLAQEGDAGGQDDGHHDCQAFHRSVPADQAHGEGDQGQHEHQRWTHSPLRRAKAPPTRTTTRPRAVPP